MSDCGDGRCISDPAGHARALVHCFGSDTAFLLARTYASSEPRNPYWSEILAALIAAFPEAGAGKCADDLLFGSVPAFSRPCGRGAAAR